MKLIKKLVACALSCMVFATSVTASTTESVENSVWKNTYNNNVIEECDGYTIVTGEIGDNKVTLDTSNQHFYSTKVSNKGKEVFGVYDSKVDSGKLVAGDNLVTIYFNSDDRFISARNTITLTLSKDSQAKPTKITISSRGKNYIKIKPVSGCQYKITGRKWQSSTKFTKLKSGKTYKVYMRYKETSTQNASGVVSKKVTTKK